MKKPSLSRFSLQTLLYHPHFPLLCVGLLALATRLVYLLLADRLSLFPDLFLDSKFYENTALAIHQGLGAGQHPYLLSPLYPYLMQPFIDDGGFNAQAMRLVQAFAGAIVAVLCADIARRLSGKAAAGWIAGIVCATYGPLVHYDALILVASLQTFGITLCLWLLVARPLRHQLVVCLLAGLALGFSTALRPTGLLLALAIAAALPFFAWLENRQAWKPALLHSLVFALGISLMVAPFTLRNIKVSDEAVLLSANGGINFWIGNHAGSHGVFNLPPDYDLVHDPLGIEIARRESGEMLNYRESSTWWREQAMQDIRKDVPGWLGLLAKKGLIFAHSLEIPQLGLNFQWFSEKAWVLRLLPIDARQLLICGLFAGFFMYLLHGWQGILQLRWPLLLLLVYWAGITLFFVTGRYRAPVMPMAIALSAITLVSLPELFRLKKRVSMFTGLAVMLLVIAVAGELFRGNALLPQTLFSSGAEERQRGMALYDQGDYAAAEAAYRASLSIRDNAITRGNLANSLKAQGKLDEALVEYRKSLQLDPRNAVAWYNLGNTYRDHFKQPVQAMEAYRKAINIQPLFAEAYLNLGLLEARSGQHENAISSLKAYLETASAMVTNREAVQAMIEELEAASIHDKIRQALKKSGKNPTPDTSP